MNTTCLELLDEIPFRDFFSPFKERILKEKNAGVSLYEDDETVYVEVAMPGVKPEEVHVTFDRRGVAIEGQVAEEPKKNAKYHLKSASIFSYWIPLPSGKIDENASVQATAKNGIVQLTFPKSRLSKPLKIEVRSA